MSQSNNDNCFLLHQRSFGETSIIADVFTQKSGKISWKKRPSGGFCPARKHVTEAKRRGLSCGVGEAQFNTKINVASRSGLYAERSDANVCQNYSISNLAKTEAKKRGLTCGASGPEFFTANNISCTLIGE